MTLEDYLKERIEATHIGLKKTIINSKQELTELESIYLDLNNAEYHVSLTSLWLSEGGASCDSTYTGSLKDAIEKTEVNFLNLNDKKRSNISSIDEFEYSLQATYSVHIVLGDHEYALPDKYWIQYKKKDSCE
ncbi:MAG: hypothetical protein GQ477_05835 [Nanohaloarchaea archaeon]|nr:hypothetical protein [Candidatus Nanohaloarchaea archaeon]